jgi:hypothetical protein
MKTKGRDGGGGAGDTYLDHWDKYMKYSAMKESKSQMNWLDWTLLPPEEKALYKATSEKGADGHPIMKITESGMKRLEQGLTAEANYIKENYKIDVRKELEKEKVDPEVEKLQTEYPDYKDKIPTWIDNGWTIDEIRSKLKE